MSVLIDWDDPNTKESHRGKTLAQHISEVLDFYEKLLTMYRLDRVALPLERRNRWINLVRLVCKYHDMGKLNPEWSVYNERNPPHSIYSIEWIEEHRDNLDDVRRLDSGETILLYLLIAKHHSRLSKLPTSVSYRGLRRARRWLDKNAIKTGSIEGIMPDKYERVYLADLFGLFKIADTLSANDVEDVESVVGLNPVVTEDDIRMLLEGGGRFDEERFREQLRISSLGDKAVLRAYTGWGKTSLSLLYITRERGVNKAFYILPTITSINKLYSKVSSSEPLEQLFGFYYYFADIEFTERIYGEPSSMDESRDLEFQLLLISKFIRHKIYITTFDQFIFSTLRMGRYHSKRLNFYNSALVFDEIHLYNPRMLALLIGVLRLYQPIYKFKTLFMSATLPDKLIDILRDYLDIDDKDVLDYIDGYRDIRRIKYVLRDAAITESVDEIYRRYLDGHRVLVIVNRPERAVTLMNMLKELGVKDGDIVTIHGRFMYIDRRRYEERLMTDDVERYPRILVTTQVAEVSLDISYDLLYTEVAPIPSLIQRFGRVNRYSKDTDEINVYIYRLPEGENSHYPYGMEEVETAWKVLQNLEGDNLIDEGQLFDEYNRLFNVEPYLRELRMLGSGGTLDNVLEVGGLFYTLDVTDEKVKRWVDFRGSSILALIDPGLIYDEERREEYSGILEKWLVEKGNVYSVRHERWRELKKYLVPIPIPIYLGNRLYGEGEYLLINLENYYYHPRHGLVSVEVLKNVY